MPREPPTDITAELRPLLLDLQTAIEGLPGKISKAAGEAMRQQHNTNRRDLEELWRKIAIEAEMISARHDRQTAAVQKDAAMQAFDERFQWLVNELSERFVLFGNGLARIEKRLDGPNNGTAARSRHVAEPDGSFSS